MFYLLQRYFFFDSGPFGLQFILETLRPARAIQPTPEPVDGKL